MLDARGSTIDVPLLPAVVSIVEVHGWTEDPSLTAPALVDRRRFNSAMTTLAE
jgi:hypothetical protein